MRAASRPALRLAALTLALVLCWLLAAAGVAAAVERASGDRFNLAQWEISRLPRKYVHDLGAWLRGGSAGGRDDFLRYFRAGDRRDPALTPAAEAGLESALAEVIARQGLDRTLPLLPGGRLVWPPVDVSFDDVPYVLIVARRDRIALVRTEVLRPGLSSDDIARIEGEAEGRGYSALVEPLGGFAAYPSVIRVTDGPNTAIDIAAHEWVHHYLAFYPLGAAYGASQTMTSINETVADMVGRELAAGARSQLAVPTDPPAAGQAPRVDTGRVLRDLRMEVDALLAAGNVPAAEARMEQVRQDLAAQGMVYRRINQAFLAFRNVYADTPGARNPVGQALARLRRASPSLAAFVARVRQFSRPEDLEAALGMPAGSMVAVR